MARGNAGFGTWVADLLEVGPNDSVLKVGFGPGVVIRYLSELTSAGHVAGVDPSPEMLEQARARNAATPDGGRVELRLGFVECLPFEVDSFDGALVANSMQV